MSQDPRLRVAPRAVKSFGDLAADFAGDYGLRPDAWQQIVLDDWLAEKSGRWASLTCGLSVPRQNGKNALIEVRELFGMVGRGEKILHTAHQLPTARKAFKRLLHFFGSQPNDPSAKFPELNALVAEVRTTNGQEAVILHNGGSVEIVARSKNSGRGFTVDVLVMDEAQELDDDDLEALMPTTSSAPQKNPQWIFTGTPPGPKAAGDVFHRVRREALEGKSARLAWHEWSCGDDVDLDDRDEWRMANPGLLSGRLQMEVVEGERARFSVDGFARERLGMWSTSVSSSVIEPRDWSACVGEHDSTLPLEVLGVASTMDLTHSTLVGASLDGEVVQVKPIHHQPGTSWVVARVAELQAVHDCEVVIDERGPAAMLIPALEQAGVTLTAAKTVHALDACAGFLDAVREHAVRHASYNELDAAVKDAVQRNVGDRWAWGRKASDVDIAPLEAATFAHWLLTRPAPEPVASAYADHDLIII